jgi:hypothetical protein
MTEPIASWIEGYRRAWLSNDRADIETLFTDEAEYRDGPHGEPWVGREAIIAGWLEQRDAPGDAEFEWEALVDDPELSFVQGVSTYASGRVYDNLWVIRRADDGRATAFTDWWIERT